jgi:NAD(P)-dependent dehydrogenase (short-subunit alcohol dehydrogenase family)
MRADRFAFNSDLKKYHPNSVTRFDNMLGMYLGMGVILSLSRGVACDEFAPCKSSEVVGKGNNSMTIAGKTVLVTGANRGIGLALVRDALARGAARVYAGTRQPLSGLGERVTLLNLDVTDDEQVRQAAAAVQSLDILVNNAGVALYDNLNDRSVLDSHLNVNLFGPYRMAQAFLPALAQSHGAIVNVLSLAGVAAIPMLPAYSISKAAAFSLSQSLRAIWASRGVTVHVVLPGPVDTEMSRDLDVPKASADSVARAIFDGVEHGDDEIFPDPMSHGLADDWSEGSLKVLERQFGSFIA